MEFQIFQKFQYLIYIQNLQISSLFISLLIKKIDWRNAVWNWRGKNLYITELQESHDVIKKLFFTEIKVDIVYCLLPKAIVLNFYYMEFQIFQKFQYLIYIQNLQKKFTHHWASEIRVILVTN